jgi:hypothetical protein
VDRIDCARCEFFQRECFDLGVAGQKLALARSPLVVRKFCEKSRDQQNA